MRGDRLLYGWASLSMDGFGGTTAVPRRLTFNKEKTEMKLSILRLMNVKRCEEVFHPLNAWTPTDWACAMAGEAGEVCNAVKKLRRLADGTNTAKDPQTESEAIKAIGAELADTIIYCDLLAARLGLDLSVEVQAKFNEVSRRMNSTVRL